MYINIEQKSGILKIAPKRINGQFWPDAVKERRPYVDNWRHDELVAVRGSETVTR